MSSNRFNTHTDGSHRKEQGQNLQSNQISTYRSRRLENISSNHQSQVSSVCKK